MLGPTQRGSYHVVELVSEDLRTYPYMALMRMSLGQLSIFQAESRHKYLPYALGVSILPGGRLMAAIHVPFL